MQEKVEQVILGLTAIFSVVVSVLDWLQLLHLPPGTVSSLTLLGLGLIAGYLVLERRGVLGNIGKRISLLENRYSQVSAFFGAIQENDSFAELRLIYGLRTYAELASDTTIRVRRNQILVLWRDCISRCERWRAVSYAKQEETWDTGWGDAISQGIQQERITAGATIQRVFIVDDEGEYERLEPVMQKQKNIGVEVRWLTKDELLESRLVKERLDDLGTIDVCIVDDSWIFRTHFDKKTRQMTNAEAVRNHDLTEKARLVFTEAFTRARVF